MTRPARVEFGDWQTPAPLADAALALAARHTFEAPATVLEPTCGEGAFLRAAARLFPEARLLGYELNRAHADKARAQLPRGRREIRVADFFQVDWVRELEPLPGPILVVGNPPWVTSAQLGILGSQNLPEKLNFKGLRGYEALTGKSNFDVSEWMILRLLTVLTDQRAGLAFLCKSAVARRVVELAAKWRLAVAPGGLWRIDAMEHFAASVDAVLFVCKTGEEAPDACWPVYAALDADRPESTIAMLDGVLVANADGYRRTRHLVGDSKPQWRSGVKHDCARVMELERVDGRWLNGIGETVELEAECVFPMLKSSDVANHRLDRERAMIVPQRALGEDTSALRKRAPKTWKYLARHGALLDARKSSIYKRQPRFALFGLGEYSFAPWKVAISGMYKRYAFALVGPKDGRPVVLDDTCYFLPFTEEEDARRAIAALRSPQASDFLGGRVFWDAKRPISKAILQTLDLDALRDELGLETTGSCDAARCIQYG